MENKDKFPYLYYLNSNHFKERLLCTNIPIRASDLLVKPLPEQKYQTGTFLSFTVNRLNEVFSEDRLNDSRYSFIDSTTQIILNEMIELDIFGYKMNHTERLLFDCSINEPNITLSKFGLYQLNSFLVFIEMCVNHSEQNTIEDFRNFSSVIRSPIIDCEKITKNPDLWAIADNITEDVLHNALLDEKERYKSIMESFKEARNKGNPYPVELRQKLSLAKSRTMYINVYHITSIKDLLSASLLEIFNVNRVIKKCRYCGKIFVPLQRRDTKYCNLPPDYFTKKTCKELAILKSRRNHYNNNQIKNLYDRLRNRLYNRMKQVSDSSFSDKDLSVEEQKCRTDYYDFLTKFGELSDFVRTANAPEEKDSAEQNLLKWLQSMDVSTRKRKA